MNYTMIDRQDAPARAPQRRKRRIEGLEDLVASLAPGRVARIQLGENEKARPVLEQIYRTASRSGKLVEVWEVGGVLYAELAGEDS